jgi:hypothetical protein
MLRATLRPIALVFLWLTWIAAPQAQVQGKLHLEVVMNDGARREIRDATILVYSSRGFIVGGEDQAFDGIYVTKPVIPLNREAIAPARVPWARIVSLEILGRENRGSDYFTRGAVVSLDGTRAEYFFWSPASRDTWSEGGFTNLRITGKSSTGEEGLSGLSIRSIRLLR